MLAKSYHLPPDRCSDPPEKEVTLCAIFWAIWMSGEVESR